MESGGQKGCSCSTTPTSITGSTVNYRPQKKNHQGERTINYRPQQGKMHTASPTRNQLLNKPIFADKNHDFILKATNTYTHETTLKQRCTTWFNWKSQIYILKVYITNYMISGYLVLSKTSTETTSPHQMVLDIWPCQKTSRLIRKRSGVQTASNISLYFWFTGLIHKNTVVFYWSNNVCCCIANNNPSCPGSLAGNSTWGQDSSLAEKRGPPRPSPTAREMHRGQKAEAGISWYMSQ